MQLSYEELEIEYRKTIEENALLKAQISQKENDNKNLETRAKSMGNILNSSIFFKMIDNSMSGNFIILENRFLYINARMCEIFGYKKDDMQLFNHFQEIFLSEDRELMSKNIKSLLDGELSNIQLEIRGKRKDEAIIYLQVFGTTFEYYNKKVAIGTVFDVTEKYKTENQIQELLKKEMRFNEELISAEEELRQTLDQTLVLNERLLSSENELRRQKDFLNKIIEYMPVGIFAKDVQNDYRFSLWNAKMEQLFGNRKDEMLGKNDYDLVPNKEEVAYFRRTDEEVMNKKVVLDIPFEVVNTQATSLQVHTIKVPIYNDKGEPETLLGILEDISARVMAQIELLKAKDELEQKVKERTWELSRINKELEIEIIERRQAEGELFESKELYRTLIKHFPNGIVNLYDKNFCFVISEGTEHEILGIDKENIINKRIDEVYDVEIVQTLESLISKGFHDIYSTKDIQFKGQYYSIQTFPIKNENGEIHLVMELMQNISKHKHAEVILLKAFEKERELNQLRTQFISIASHEFRTPVTGISISTEMLEQMLQPIENENAKKCFDRIYDCIKNLMLILDDISLIAKDQQGKLDFEPSPMHFEEFCQGLVDEMNGFYPKADIINNINSTINEVIMDKKLLRYIISNLLINAIKYSDKNLPVIIETTNNEPYSVRITVKDFGIGIPKEDLPNIYEPFHRSANVLNIKGTGLGMSIIKRCVDLHSGRIRIESEIDKGTMVEIVLPYKK